MGNGHPIGVRGLVGLTPSLAIGGPCMEPTLQHRVPRDLAWRYGKQETGTK